MLWTPIVRLVALYYEGRAREKMSFALSFTLVAGHFLAWLIAFLMNGLFSYRMSFLLPAAVAALCALPTRFLLPGRAAGSVSRAREKRSGSVKTLFQMGFGFLLLLGVTSGFARDGVMTWAPSILSDAGDTALLTALLIPCVNLLGLLLGRGLYRAMRGRGRPFCLLLFALCGAVCLLLTQVSGGFPAAFLLGLCCALMYGVNPILTTMFPLEYEGLGLVGLSAGMIDCAIYLGSALTGVLGGTLKEAAGWGGLYLSWALAMGLGVLCCLLSEARLKRFSKARPEETRR